MFWSVVSTSSFCASIFSDGVALKSSMRTDASSASWLRLMGGGDGGGGGGGGDGDGTLATGGGGRGGGVGGPRRG